MYQRVTLIGFMGRDPDISETRGGKMMARFSVATSKRVKRDDKWDSETTWHEVTCFGYTARKVAEKGAKGRPCCVIGEISVREYKDQGGAKKKFYGILAYTVIVFDSMASALAAGKPSESVGDKNELGEEAFPEDEDIPF